MRLSELNTGERAVVVKVNGHGSFRKRILEMGFVKGKVVTVILNAPLKDPIEYEIIGYKISLRREEAAKIEVISENEAKTAFMDNGEHRLAIEVDCCNDEMLVEGKMKSMAEEMRRIIRVALVGNPNCGKTSLFNIASGSHEHVGNYSGVTVDAKEGRFEHGGYTFILVDLPGTYSLSAYSPEEIYVRKNLIEESPDVVVNVVDASNMERNLYLTTQLIDMNLRVVMALNMYDELMERGDELDIRTLGHLLGMSVIPTISRSGKGIHELFDTVIKVYENNDPQLGRHIHINHGQDMEESIDRIKLLIQKNPDIRYKWSTRYLAIKYLENDSGIGEVVEALPNRDEIIAARFEEQKRIESMLGSSTESAIVDAKYAFVQGALKETWKPAVKRHGWKRSLTDRIDTVVTNKWAAFPIFFFMLYLVFQCTFYLGDYPMQWIEWLVEMVGDFVSVYMAPGWWKDMIVDGVIGGVGSVLVFLPNILLLYLFISLLEDSGYMARAAFIMDRLMHRMGLHGKSFIPMVMGFGCNVPAIMATRMIESRKSRLITILIIPLMSCAGRLPVYILIAGAFFPGSAGIVLLGLYALGIVLAILAAKVLSRFVKDDDLPFVMELPPYRVPTAKSVFRHTWEKGRQYLQKMSGIILVCSVAIWALGYFPNHNSYNTVEEQQEHSYIGYVGKAMEPVLEPLGFDWRMGVGIVAGVGAKELVVSTLGVMYSGHDEQRPAVTADSAPAFSDAAFPDAAFPDVAVLNAVPDSSHDFAMVPEADSASGIESEQSANTSLQRALVRAVSPAAGLAYMVFILLYFPCIATFIAIKNEAGGWKWAILTAVYTILLAWIAAFITFRLSMLMGL
ncbi:MAG: ferrous iron transport protein B [Clostridium sp.]|nr:ferrous iron transport protein B [Bacteroides sp.]MCM1197672.1 ferrous iron transport protein B [Clostridium sp.]